MCRRTRAWAVMAVFLPVAIALAAEPFKTDFNDGNLDGWYASGGDWKVVGGKLVQRQAGWGRHVFYTRIRLEEGTLSARMRVDVADQTSGANFGFAIRYPGDVRYSVMRIGGYGAISLMQPVKDANVCAFRPEVGREYDVKLQVARDKVAVFVDGRLMGSAVMTDAKGSGGVGFYTECQATFDDFEVAGNWRLGAALGAADVGAPNLKVEFAEWVPVLLDAASPIGVNGSVYVFCRNAGPGGASIDHVAIAGLAVRPQEAPDLVAYVRQQPAIMRAGEVGVLEIRLCGLPKSVGLKLVENPGKPVLMPVTIAPKRGAPVEAEVDVASTPALQINFMAFSEDLKTLYAYLQNNKALADPKHPSPNMLGAGLTTPPEPPTEGLPQRSGIGPKAKPAAVARIEVDGTDVTASARLGQKTVASDVVPLTVALPKPLAKGKPVRMVVTTEDGGRTGLVLRAFPSKFHILICTSRNARKDFVEDIYAHCATALNQNVGERERKESGFDLIPMSRSFLTEALAARERPVEGVWVDEVDKEWGQPVGKLTREMDAAELHMMDRGEQSPLFCFNVCSPQGSAASGHLTAPDAVMHAYGWHMCPATKKGFGRVYDLPRREYRLARRPFWPYFRDSEIAVPRDPRTKIMKPRIPELQRCLTPQEQRWLAFGTLIQGAKSHAHWGYWAYPMSGFYFMPNQPCLRLGLGGIAGNRVGPYVIPDEVVKMLKDVWDEHARINAELQTIGPLVAKSDVSHFARVVQVTPEKDRYGDPAAEAAALVSGLDTMVLIVLNHNIDPGKSPYRSGPVSNPEAPKYEPVSATVEVEIPEWLDPKYLFSVDYKRIADASLQRDGRRLRFVFPKLVVSEIVVITSSNDVKHGCLARHADMQKRLRTVGAMAPAPDESWRDVDVK